MRRFDKVSNEQAKHMSVLNEQRCPRMTKVCDLACGSLCGNWQLAHLPPLDLSPECTQKMSRFDSVTSPLDGNRKTANIMPIAFSQSIVRQAS